MDKDLLNTLAGSAVEAAVSSSTDLYQRSNGLLHHPNCHLHDFLRAIDNGPSCSGHTVAITIVFMRVKIQFMAVIVNCFAGSLQLS